MKHFLRTIIGLSIVLLALSVTALSCNKDGGSGSGSGGNNSGNNSGGGDSLKGDLKFEFDSASAKLDGEAIKIKESVFPKPTARNAFASSFSDGFLPITTAPAASLKRIFDVKVDGKGGLVLVGPGNLTTNDFSLEKIDKAIADYSAADQREGVRNIAPVAAATANGHVAIGWNIYGLFMDDSHGPYTTDSAAKANPDVAPFAFSQVVRGAGVQPFVLCRTTITTITSGADAGNGTAQDTTKLTGGEKATCFIGVKGGGSGDFSGTLADRWFTFTDTNTGGTYKKKFNMAFVGIATDEKTIAEISLTGGSASLRDGLSKAEIAQLVSKNPSGYKKLSIEIVRDANF